MIYRVFRIAGPLAAAALAAGCQPSPEQLAARYSEVVKGYCVDCHDYAGQTGGLSLEGVDLTKVAEHEEIFEKVARKLRGRQMPPPGDPQPDDKTRASFVAYLERRLDDAAAAAPKPGPATIHRLNRTEYGNAVRDLLALDVDATEFLPADDEGYGFDNIADVLRVSPSLLEQYLTSSAKIAALAVGDPAAPPVTTAYRAPSDLAQAEHIEGLPFGTRGGILIHHNFPLDAEYDFSVFLLRNIVGYMTGLEWPHQLEIAIDGERVFLAQVGGQEDNAMSDANMSAAANEIDARLRTRVFVTAGPHDVSVTFLERSAAETHEPLELHTRNLDLQDMNGLPVLDYVNVAGPFNARGPGDTPSRERIFSCKPADSATARVCATEILSKLARRAYRRQPSEQDIALLLSFYDSGATRAGFDAGIESALRMLLTSPKFLFREEPDPEGAPPGSLYAVGDSALASRLSFFLWSSIPDDELLDLAAQGKLSDPEVYRKQVMRMLADPRVDALVKNFAGQWLFLRNLPNIHPSTEEFPDFDDNLRQAMRRETELLFQNVMREDHGVLELLTADYTFVNERLARHYGIEDVYGSQFRKVPIKDENRRGLLGQASILTITSYPNRTSPVLRGKWVLENVLGTPAPAPPPNVPALKDNEDGRTAQTLRERLAAHRTNPVCATCHDIMDPIGLGLENFDAVGRWRTREPGGPIDSHGQLADGTKIDGAADLRKAVTSDPEQFARVFTTKLMTYALGRGLETYDMPTVRKIVRDAAPENYKFSAIVYGIANSVPFRMRRAQSPTPPAATTVASATKD
jgi:mono/diheme cytochrome c family protein